MANKIESACGGYGSAHGPAGGRLWFACGRCRWSSGPAKPIMTREEALALVERQIAALDRDLAGEAMEAAGLCPHG